MKINWDRWINRAPKRLPFIGIMLILAGAALAFMDLTKPVIESRSDLIFVSGAFGGYSWVKLTHGSSLTFSLQNYNDRFKIKADFFGILEKEKFETIPVGKIITIAVPKSYAKYLNHHQNPAFVYGLSLVEGDEVYLDFEEVIKKHNSHLIIIFSLFYILLGIYFISLAQRAKAKALREQQASLS